MKPKPKRKPRKARSAEELLAAIQQHHINLYPYRPYHAGTTEPWQWCAWPVEYAAQDVEAAGCRTPREALSRLLDKLEAK